MAGTIKRQRREKLLLSITKGGFVPADGYTQKRLRERGYKMGDVVLADLAKPRNPGFHRLAHRLGQLVVENIEGFESGDAHDALKRIQIEAGIACDEITVYARTVDVFADASRADATGLVARLVDAILHVVGARIKSVQRIPRSLSFASMDETEFRATVRAMCEYIAINYWPSLTPEQIERMVDAMPDPA